MYRAVMRMDCDVGCVGLQCVSVYMANKGLGDARLCSLLWNLPFRCVFYSGEFKRS
jgi:hypothetical protein